MVDVALLRIGKVARVIDASVFDAWWERPLVWVDEPNRRRGGMSRTGVANSCDWPELATTGRIYVKRQEAFYCRPVWNAFRRTPTLRREHRFLLYCAANGIAVPRVLGYAERGDRSLLILAAIEHTQELGRALEERATEREEILDHTLNLLKRLHHARVRHGALHPKHLLVDERRLDVWLIDLEKARRATTRRRAAEPDLAQFFRHAPFLTQAERTRFRDAYVSADLIAR